MVQFSYNDGAGSTKLCQASDMISAVSRNGRRRMQLRYIEYSRTLGLKSKSTSCAALLALKPYAITANIGRDYCKSLPWVESFECKTCP